MVVNTMVAGALLTAWGCGWGEYTEAVEVSANDVCVRSNRDHVECFRYEGTEVTPAIDKPSDSYVALDGGAYHLCGLTETGEIECWGATTYNKTEPVPQGPFTNIMLGEWNGCAVRADKTASCWGTDAQGSATIDETISWTSVAPGDTAICAISDPAGSIICWGKYWYEQGTLAPPEGIWGQVWGGGGFFAARKADGTLAMWGNNEDGELNFPDGLQLIDLALGADHSCALRPDGEVVCWGSNEAGQLDVPAGETFVDIDSRRRFNCGVTTDHRLLCWGCYSDLLYSEGHRWCQTPTPSWDG